MKSINQLVILLVLTSSVFAQKDELISQTSLLLSQSSTLNCGLKPIPKIGYEIGRCVNGEWERNSRTT